MSFHRVVLVALATLFSIGMTSFASAGCCGLGYTSPVVYAAPVGYGGYGGYGGCCGGPTAAAVYAQPMAPAPIVVSNPVMVTPFGGPCCGWSGCGNCGGSSCGGCGGCGGCGLFGGGGGLFGGGWGGGGWGGGCCASTAAYVQAPYMVNQGPTYSGPGLMQPYATYSPDTAYAPAADYPYVPGNGNGYGPAPVPPPYYSHLYYHPHYAYRAPLYAHPRSYAPQPHYYYGAPQWRHYP